MKKEIEREREKEKEKEKENRGGKEKEDIQLKVIAALRRARHISHSLNENFQISRN